MPTIFIEGYKFRFYSSDRNEPPHFHVIHNENVANIWLQPVSIAYNRGYNNPESNRILKLTQENNHKLLEVWNAYFSK